MATKTQLATQWQNPGDILSLLLLVGGDVVQRAIAQLVGVYVQPFRNGPRLYLTPVAFSFGWVGYAFTSLASVIGDKQLMPSEPDCPSKVINCSTGYSRTNRSWLLGRILRDHELAVEDNPGPKYAELAATGKMISLSMGVFKVQEEDWKPQIDRVWLLGWTTITAQLGVSITPRIRYGDWGIFLITACGTAFALLTGSLPAMAAREPVCLTRDNGHRFAMILIGKGTAPDLEGIATAKSESLAETPWLLGLKQNTWFLVLIGGIGLVQNIYASAASRSSAALNMRLTPYRKRPSIVGLGFDWPYDDDNSDEELGDEAKRWRQALKYDQVPGVRGAIRELEKTIPMAGVALMQEFFPALNKYEPARYRTNAEKKFWKKAFREFGMPVPSITCHKALDEGSIILGI
ncbi:hypothetical protein BDR22DRAFT_888307 [Usnea florida]